LARKTVREESGAVGMPFVVVVGAYPLGVWVAVFADENGSRPGALVVAAVVVSHSSRVPFASDQTDGYAEAMFKPSRCASSGYFASSLEKLRRARDGEEFGNAVGFRPIKAQRCIAFASRIRRISGRAFMFSFSSGEALRLSLQYSRLGVAELSVVFPAKLAILRVCKIDPSFRNSKNSAP